MYAKKSMKTIVIVGAGKGLGNAIGRQFAKNGFQIVLLARQEEHLRAYEAELSAEGYSASTHVADAADPASLAAALDWVQQEYGAPDVLVYNVGITSPDTEDMDAEELVRHFRADVAGAYQCARHISTAEFADKGGVIIFTGGGLALYPVHFFTPLSIDKAALRALAYTLHEQLKPRGIFVGTVTVSGSIGSDAYFAPERIAEAYWMMYEKRETCEIVYTYPEQEAARIFSAEGPFAEEGKDAATATERVSMAFWGRNAELTRS